MFQMNHDAVDFFSVDFTSACTIVAREEYPLGHFAAQAMEVSGRLDGDIDAAAKEFAAECSLRHVIPPAQGSPMTHTDD